MSDIVFNHITTLGFVVIGMNVVTWCLIYWTYCSLIGEIHKVRTKQYDDSTKPD